MKPHRTDRNAFARGPAQERPPAACKAPLGQYGHGRSALLDGLVQLSVLDRDLSAPPGSSSDGDRYIVVAGATGDWAGWDLNVALWTDGAWLRLPPRTGWRAWVEDEGLLVVYDGADWVGTTPASLQNLALLGLGTTADASNPFSAKLNAALWTAKAVAEGVSVVCSLCGVWLRSLSIGMESGL
jgi:hypothetical protein